MEWINSRDIAIPSIIAFTINAISAYLFALHTINISTLIFIVIGSIVVILIIGIQLKTRGSSERLNNLELEQQKLVEKLKIHEQLIDMKAEIKELQKKVFKK